MEQFLGSAISLKCIGDIGTYQGQIVDLKKDCITLGKAFYNGVPVTTTTVNINTKDILNVEFIPMDVLTTNEVDNPTQNKVVVKRPIAKRVGRSISESVSTSLQLANSKLEASLKKPEVVQPPPEISNGKPTTIPIPIIDPTNKTVQKRLNHKQRALERDEHTFGTPIDQSLHQEFDFEKNLALFNKEAVWQEINSLKPDIVRQSENNRGTTASYRHDENIIVAKPTVFRQILVPTPAETEYVTDIGLVVPSITLNLHRQLIGAADRLGISWERRVELLGRAGTEIVLQLLGGSHRLNPNNAHQWPTVVALCGPHRPGAAGVNCARQLSSHGVKTIVFVENPEDVFLLQEISLYKLTKNKVEDKIKNLPPVVDLVILALCDENSPREISAIAKWASKNKAPILAIEPPADGTPGIPSKCSLIGGLPLNHTANNGRLYLCNLALPNKIFADVGITYRSPFGPKFVIPLHPNHS